VCGVLPYHTIFKYMDKTITKQVNDLTDYARVLENNRKTEAATAALPSSAGSLVQHDKP
jgi:hypothetical protein